MFRYTLYIILFTLTLNAENLSCKLQNNEKNLLSNIYDPVGNESFPLDNSKLFCTKDTKNNSLISWSSFPDGVLSYTLNVLQDSTVITYAFDEGTAYRGEGCGISVSDKNFIQTEKSCGTDGCDIYVWHNKREVFSTQNKKTNSARMPIEFISGFFMLVGMAPTTHQTYEGLVNIEVKKEKIIMTRWVQGVKVIAIGEEAKNLEGISNIYFSWKTKDKEIKLNCQANSDNDNYPRLTCKSYINKEASFGIETLFHKSEDIDFYETVDLDGDGTDDDITIKYIPKNHQVRTEAKMSSTKSSSSISFQLDNSTIQEAFCGHFISVSSEKSVNPLNHTETINGLVLDDYLCDGFHIFWNKQTSSLNYWRN